MTGQKRPIDSGRRDSQGRPIKVAENSGETRADAPNPPTETDTRDYSDWVDEGYDLDDAKAFEDAGIELAEAMEWAEHGYHDLADIQQQPYKPWAPTGGAVKTALADITDQEVHVTQTGGNVATIYIGPTFKDDEGYDRYSIVIGPGHYDWDNPDNSSFDFEELCVGPDDDGETEPVYVENMQQLQDVVRRQTASAD